MGRGSRGHGSNVQVFSPIIRFLSAKNRHPVRKSTDETTECFPKVNTFYFSRLDTDLE